jgi:hypothetical protein
VKHAIRLILPGALLSVAQMGFAVSRAGTFSARAVALPGIPEPAMLAFFGVLLLFLARSARRREPLDFVEGIGLESLKAQPVESPANRPINVGLNTSQA